MKTVLITGFEPFGGESVNPSWEVVSGLDNAIIGGAKVSDKIGVISKHAQTTH